MLSLALLLVSGTTDENTLFLVDKITHFVNVQYNGDHKRAFLRFDTSEDGVLDRDELWYALSEIGVGTYVTRGRWVDGIVDYFGTEPSLAQLSTLVQSNG